MLSILRNNLVVSKILFTDCPTFSKHEETYLSDETWGIFDEHPYLSLLLRQKLIIARVIYTLWGNEFRTKLQLLCSIYSCS